MFVVFAAVNAQYGAFNDNKITSGQQKQMVDYFNQARSQVGSPNLHWDTRMERAGLDCLKRYSNGGLNHGICGDSIGKASGYGSAGENIATGDGPSAALTFVGEICEVRNWNTLLRPRSYQFDSSVGHYSQVVWKTSVKVSCVQVTYGGVIYCHFAPAGNVIYFSGNAISKLPDINKYCSNGVFSAKRFNSIVIPSHARFTKTASKAIRNYTLPKQASTYIAKFQTGSTSKNSDSPSQSDLYGITSSSESYTPILLSIVLTCYLQ
eukprot:NODE_411_length_9170_cov_0.431154.p4 type:complete len:265 gc:universal NODE_411_length_9170_cov_0.431154:4548-5342(+)